MRSVPLLFSVYATRSWAPSATPFSVKGPSRKGVVVAPPMVMLVKPRTPWTSPFTVLPVVLELQTPSAASSTASVVVKYRTDTSLSPRLGTTASAKPISACVTVKV